MFISLLQYYISLSLTSLTSTIILNNFTSIATLILSIFFLRRKFDWNTTMATVVSFMSIVIIALSDSDGTETNVYGDIIALTGAVTYGVFSIVVFYLFSEEKEEGFSYFTILGMVGGITLITGWLLVLIAHFTHFERFELPDLETFGYLCLNVVFGTISYEYFNGKAILYLGPLVTDISLCLVIPLSLLVGMFWNGA